MRRRDLLLAPFIAAAAACSSRHGIFPGHPDEKNVPGQFQVGQRKYILDLDPNRPGIVHDDHARYTADAGARTFDFNDKTMVTSLFAGRTELFDELPGETKDEIKAVAQGALTFIARQKDPADALKPHRESLELFLATGFSQAELKQNQFRIHSLGLYEFSDKPGTIIKIRDGMLPYMIDGKVDIRSYDFIRQTVTAGNLGETPQERSLEPMKKALKDNELSQEMGIAWHTKAVAEAALARMNETIPAHEWTPRDRTIQSAMQAYLDDQPAIINNIDAILTRPDVAREVGRLRQLYTGAAGASDFRAYEKMAHSANPRARDTGIASMRYIANVNRDTTPNLGSALTPLLD